MVPCWPAGLPRSGGVAATDASRVRLPSSEGLFFASRACHAAAAKAATDPFSYIGPWGSGPSNSAARVAQRRDWVRVFRQYPPHLITYAG